MELLISNAAIAAHLLFIYVVLVFFVAQISHDNSVMDIAYGPAFFVAVGGTLIATMNFATLPTIIVACISLWSARLSIRIFRKNKGKPEDARYAAWRKAWNQKGVVYFVVRTFLQINILQGIIIFLVALPGIIALSSAENYSPLFAAVGLAVFAFGLGYETVADWQLDQFLKGKRAGTTTEPLMKTGLFAYSRRPNYFGETLVWWGLAIMVLPLPFGWLGLISPILITYIVSKVTGPMLEKIFLEKYPEEYRAYMTTTPYIYPRLFIS